MRKSKEYKRVEALLEQARDEGSLSLEQFQRCSVHQFPSMVTVEVEGVRRGFQAPEDDGLKGRVEEILQQNQVSVTVNLV